MRGYVPNPSGLNTRKGERGWLARQQEAQRKMAEHIAGFEERRAAAEAEQERNRLAQAEAEKRREATKLLRVTCPCCGSGAVPILTAERVLTAFDRSKIDENKQLQARQEDDHRACPVCDGGRVDAEKADRIVAALASLPADYEPFPDYLRILHGIAANLPYHGVYALRVAKGAVWPRRADAVPAQPVPVIDTEDDAAGSDEDALAAVQADPVKSPRRHVAPLPFLDGD